jgi:hypothetical protein
LQALGDTIMVVARGDSGKLLGKAVYPVLSAYRGKTLHALLTGSTATFTGKKDATKSAGELKSTFVKVGSSVGGNCGTNTGCIGDLFLDMDHALVANAQSGFKSDSTMVRLTTTLKDVATSTFGSNGHWFGGLGGKHVNQGWGSKYESSPSYPYCPNFNAYGASPGNRAGNGQSSDAFQTSNCFTTGAKAHQCADATRPAPSLLGPFPCCLFLATHGT